MDCPLCWTNSHLTSTLSQPPNVRALFSGTPNVCSHLPLIGSSKVTAARPRPRVRIRTRVTAGASGPHSVPVSTSAASSVHSLLTVAYVFISSSGSRPTLPPFRFLLLSSPINFLLCGHILGLHKQQRSRRNHLLLLPFGRTVALARLPCV